MQRAILLLVCLACAALANLEGDLTLFNDFKQTYNKKYAPAEETHRFQCFQQNLVVIDKLNANGGKSGQHSVNAFTDLCPEEFKVMHNLTIPADRKKNYAEKFTAEEVANLTASDVDWRTKGAVTHVKNQGMCGSCWSFSATGNMEGQHFRKTGKLVSLSEEELVQCSSDQGNMGCNGGLMDSAFQWVINNKGIAGETQYPYTSGWGITGTCKKNRLTDRVATFSNHQDIANDENQMATWVAANGPLAIAVDASSGWQTYSGGIVTDCTGTQLDHGVLIVGFGTSGSTNYWIVKNSWGATWGENGYIRLQRGTNQCGITLSPCTAVV